MPSANSKCPHCKDASTDRYRPFCSKRCADIDLGRWLTGGYVVAGGGGDVEDDSAEVVAPDGKNGAPEA